MLWTYWVCAVALAALLMCAARLSVAQESKSVIAIPRQTVIAKRQAEVAMLRQLSIDSAVKQPDTITDAASLAATFGAQITKVHAFASWACIRNRENAKLASGDFAVIAWAFDFVEPDAAHVMQTAWDGSRYAYDEFIEINKSKFIKLGDWIEVPPEHAGFLDTFVLQTYATVLRNERPISASTYLHSGKRYLLLEYEMTFAEAFAGFSDDTREHIRLELWIDSTSGLLAKAMSRALPGRPPFELEQEFVGYNDEIRIVAPPHATLVKPP